MLGTLLCNSTLTTFHAHVQAVTNSANTVSATKRLIGRGFDDPQTQKEVKVRTICPWAHGALQDCQGTNRRRLGGGEVKGEANVGMCALARLVDEKLYKCIMNKTVCKGSKPASSNCSSYTHAFSFG
eukprot:scaffold24140_cov14-Tisochrysis_lutea.AAC.2